MPHRDPQHAREWRRAWWKTATRSRERQNTAARRRHAKINAFLRAHKVAVGCRDCPYRGHHAALEFHHTGQKNVNLSFAKSLAQAKREMLKCVVLCSNCHRIREWDAAHPCKPDIFEATYEAA